MTILTNIRTFACIAVSLAGTAGSQAQTGRLSLQEAIRLAQEQSFEYKVAQNRHQSSLWNFRNFTASFRPKLYLDGTLPNYSRAISRITLPSGEDAFVNQNQAYSALNLGIRQQVAATGGSISVSSSLNRIDVLGQNRSIRYNTVPVSVSYSQNTIGYNPFKWQKRTEPLRMEAANRELSNAMEQIGQQAVNHYFDMLAAQTRLRLSRQNLARADTLYRLTQDRFRLGTVSQSELLQLRLNVLNAANAATQDSISQVLAQQQFVRYLSLPAAAHWELDIPEAITFFIITFDQALDKARTNSKAVIDYRLQRLDAEQNLARSRAENSLKFNIQANLGLSNTAPNFQQLYQGLENQQNVLLGFSLPLLDWGFTKTQKMRAEANLAMVEAQIEQGEMQLEQEIALHVARWNAHRQQVATATETRDIASRNYDLEMQRYLAGTISINDLNAAQGRKDDAANAYIQAIRTYWSLYYSIRRLTLYDFHNQQHIHQ